MNRSNQRKGDSEMWRINKWFPGEGWGAKKWVEELKRYTLPVTD